MKKEKKKTINQHLSESNEVYDPLENDYISLQEYFNEIDNEIPYNYSYRDGIKVCITNDVNHLRQSIIDELFDTNKKPTIEDVLPKSLKVN